MASQPGVLQGPCRRWPPRRFRREQSADKVTTIFGDVLPELLGLERISSLTDGHRFLFQSLLVEWRVTTKEEIGDYTHSPKIDRLAMTGCERMSALFASRNRNPQSCSISGAMYCDNH